MTNNDFDNSLGDVSRQSDDQKKQNRRDVNEYIALKLIANGQPVPVGFRKTDSLGAERILNTWHQRLKHLEAVRCPADVRIESFLARHFVGVPEAEGLRLPDVAFVLDRHGIARELSLPIDGEEYFNEFVSSYRVHNGVLHNPRHDRRTTKGTFHVCEGGLPIPSDKQAVPKLTFAHLFAVAMNPPAKDQELPFTSAQDKKASLFVSLLLRPLLCPKVEGFCSRQTMEVRFFAPGALVSNLDFVESIFGNAGDPFLPENDSGLDVEHWSGHTGCVILAAHLSEVTKKDAGLPFYDEAT